MKGKRPTRNQRNVIEASKLDPTKWYVQKDTPKFVQVVHVDTGETKILPRS